MQSSILEEFQTTGSQGAKPRPLQRSKGWLQAEPATRQASSSEQGADSKLYPEEQQTVMHDVAPTITSGVFPVMR